MTSVPSYPWFQESAAKEAAKKNISEMNSIARSKQASIISDSIANTKRHTDLFDRNREASDRLAADTISAVERTSSDNREHMLSVELESRADTSRNFSHVLLTAKDTLTVDAKNVGEAKFTTLGEALVTDRLTVETGDLLRQSAQKISIQEMKQTNNILLNSNKNIADMKNHVTEEYSELMAEQERNFAELEQIHAGILSDQEKGIALLGAQAERHHGDTDRRMTNYRSDIDSRLDKFGSDLALTFADLRNDLATQAARNTERVARSMTDTTGLVSDTGINTQGLVRKLDNGRISDALALSQQEALFLRMRR